MSFELIRHTDMAILPWPNGAGRRAEIATGPGWMVGFAWLDRDAPFSDYTGHDRTITLVEGPGFTLRFPQGELEVADLYRPTAFDGGWPTQCVVKGPCMVLNAVTNRATHRHSIDIDIAEIGFDPNAKVFGVVLDGELPIGGARLDAIIPADGSPVAAGNARVAVIRVSEAA